MKKVLCAFLFFVYLPIAGLSWNGNGHMTGGAIAYYYLKANNPSLIPKILAILQKHPWYNNPNQWKAKLTGLTGAQKEVALFMLASTFPDDARDSSWGKFPMTDWHYIDYPFVPNGQTIQAPQPPVPNAEEMIGKLLQQIPGESVSIQKAVDVCWLFHLIEDVHQPLHTVGLFDSNHPSGDRGGNLTFISFPSSTTAVKLHSYWDARISGSFSTIPANAQAYLNNPQYAVSRLTELNAHPQYHDWIKTESFELAKTKAYLNGKVNGSSSHPTAVTGTYSTDASSVCDRRIVLAGIRLAKTLGSVIN